MAPEAEFVKDLLIAVEKARNGKMNSSKIVQYLRDMADDVRDVINPNGQD